MMQNGPDEATPYLIESIDKNPDRHEAVVECLGAHTITILECDLLGLEEGMVLSEEQFDALIHAEQWLSCIQKALSYLDYGDCSKRRMVEKLRKTHELSICREVTDYLEEKGYINDLALAERYAENYYSVRGYGPMRIKQELYGKGFPKAVIEQVMDAYAGLDYSETVRELLLKKYGEEQLKDPAVRRKASAWMSRQGYSWSMISDVLQSFSYMD